MENEAFNQMEDRSSEYAKEGAREDKRLYSLIQVLIDSRKTVKRKWKSIKMIFQSMETID